ncbi:RNA polymerase II C-terminal domain phosphatase-like 5 [Spinacia oleracea]|uniref:RNA polymerase II C-terminal domain phosphatase-like n=1 Tax=Spinacia oleracea TaxID=3562 RepID=A0ABM3QJP0_SPIOL|nr:RNA polymerase II C-terminal domain phosphatase-like 5 [Spinacia oleracea]
MVENPITLPFDYIRPKLSLTHEAINRHRDDNLRSLLDRKKLHLILDLDHTLIHTRKTMKLLDREKGQRFKKINDAYEIFEGKFVVKLRPGVRDFLNQVSSMFDLSIYTTGTRIYAHNVVELLDKSRFMYVITREDSLKENQKSLNNVLLHERVVLIVDDKQDVWEESSRENLIKIKPYRYYLPTKNNAKESDDELTRVLSILKEVHRVFYDEHCKHNGVEYDCSNKDVREVLRRVTRRSGSPLLKIKVIIGSWLGNLFGPCNSQPRTKV